ncbi:ATP-grasp domain-containing protein [Maricaulis sp. CAU 1757]
MTRIAFLTAACMLRDHPEARKDFWEYELEIAELEPACRALGLSLETRIWDDPSFDAAEYDAVMIGTCWDYMEKPDAFLAALARCSERSRLFNPLDVVRWNADKRYLRDLADRGAPSIPTVWADRATPQALSDAFAVLDSDDVVVKPMVGASAWRQARVRHGHPLPDAAQLPPAACLIQPFLPAVSDEGEYAFIFFNRRFSHCALKRPAAGDYRVQSEYGGAESIHEPSQSELALAQSVLETIEGDLLYARIDMLRGLDGRLALIEAELIEPYLYPEQGPDMGEIFARALESLLTD